MTRPKRIYSETIELRDGRDLKYKHIQTFEGCGAFPTDMLRYDCCWPNDQYADSVEIGADPLAPQQEIRRVTVCRYSDRNDHLKWSYKRWASFGWYPVEKKEE